jgi:hypothetical protein
LGHKKGIDALVRVITVEFQTIVEAGDFVAALWLVLEEKHVPTPKLRANREPGIVHIDIEFPSEQDADVVREAISRLRLAPVLM